jgi:hypothetical protein
MWNLALVGRIGSGVTIRGGKAPNNFKVQNVTEDNLSLISVKLL